MKFPIIIILILASITFCAGQTNEQKFNTPVRNVVMAFSKQDSILLSNYINEDIGVYLLHRIGVFDNFENFKKISFSDSTYPSILFGFAKSIKLLPLKYEKLPKYDCTKESWSKKGFFVDTTKVDHLLSKICKERNKNVPDNIPSKEINSFINLENNSRRIVLFDRNSKELIFYITFVKNKWYLTILDAVTSDCSV